VLFQIFFDFEGSHAAGSGGGDGLAIAAVLYVSAGVHAGNAGEDVVVSFDVAVFVQIELPGKHGGVGDVANAEEHAGDGKDGFHAGDGVEDAQSVHGLFLNAEDFLDGGVGEELDIGVRDGAVEHDARRAEVLAAMDEGDLCSKAGEEERLFHGGIAAADDSDLVIPEEESVAGGATADAVPDERLLRRKAEPPGGRTAGNDQGACVDGFVAEVEDEGVFGEVGGGKMADAKLCAKAGGLLPHVLNQLGSLNAFRPTGEVFDQGGDGKLAARLVAFQDQGAEVGARRVDGGSESGAAGAKDDRFANSF
jgi:hypothetical protein